MEMSGYGNDFADFHRFLKDICEQLKEKSEEEDNVPIRLVNTHLTEGELEGECLDCCLQYLAARNCPAILAAALSRETYRRVSDADLSQFLETEKDADEEEEVDNRNLKKNEDEEEDVAVKLSSREYSATMLHSHIMQGLENVIKTWGEDLPDIAVPAVQYETQLHAIKNNRRKMEDSHIILPDLNSLFGLNEQPDQSFYAVYDGHAGAEAAIFSSRQLHCNLVRQCALDTDPAMAMKQAFKLTDEAFVRKAKQEGWKSGTTGVTALIRDNILYLAWLGDSQAVLVRDGKVVCNMEPHKPDRENERERIQAQGGFVMMVGDVWRVGGNIAVSRAIGDAGYKPYICSDAEVISMELDGTEDYLVLACDGLWDGVEANELPRIVFDHLLETGGDKSDVAKMLVQYAKDHDSSDNITVVVVFFRDDIAAPKQEFNLFNFQGTLSQGDFSEAGGDNSFSDSAPPTSGKLNDSTINTREPSRQNGPRDFETEFVTHSFRNTRNEISLMQDLPNVIHASSDIMNSISEPINFHPGSQDVKVTLVTKENEQSNNNETDFRNQKNVTKGRKSKESKKKLKKSKTDKDVDERKTIKNNKRVKAKSPICWAFTGKYKALVQNHKLNYAVKASNQGRLDTLIPLKVKADKLLSLSSLENVTSDQLIDLHISSVPLISQEVPLVQSTTTSTTLSTSPQPISSQKIHGSNAQIHFISSTQKFHSSWKPKRPQ
ncbi:hypothetical protein CHS0354_025133 [Potamilus streckersoni]|uniref:Protein phosphatase 1E n=1 Tax=Potamilus streckersoni TaxID=2493646 RepID=A0AAE0RWB3_9BIVA|nr:hypothetical protein CHS0354_025133 [Potamilus streckersoni]